MVNPNHITPYAEIPANERELADDLVFNRSEDALEKFIAHFESKGPGEEAEEKADPTEGMEPEEALHFHILRRKQGRRRGLDRHERREDRCRSHAQRRAAPAMKEVGDKFGAGELILPFVLQSAEVMKRAVAQLEKYLDRIEGYTKGTVVIATVFGDVHDIGKSLVNTILTNNGYTVVDLGKQVPISTILDAAVEHDATAIGLCALLVSTSKQMPACVQELHQRGLEFPVLIGGAAINRNFGLRILYPGGTESDDVYEPGVFYCKDAFEGLAKMDQLVDDEAREALVAKTREAARRLREQPDGRPTTRRRPPTHPVRSGAHRQPDPGAAVLGRPGDRGRPGRGLPPPRHPRAVQAALGRPRRQGRGLARLLSEDFQPRLERMWREQTYLHPRALLGYFPCNAEGNELIVWDPEVRPANRGARAARLPPPARHDRICLADFYRPVEQRRDRRRRAAGGYRRRRGHRADGRLEADGEFAEQLFVHGLGVQSAEGMAEWLHARVRSRAGIAPTQGRRYSWGYPACPEQSEHEKVFRLLDAPTIGLWLTGGYAVEPEQSTLAIIAHHPQAVYFGMKSGSLPKRAPGRRRADRRHRQGPDTAGRAGETDPDCDVGSVTVLARPAEPRDDATAGQAPGTLSAQARWAQPEMALLHSCCR